MEWNSHSYGFSLLQNFVELSQHNYDFSAEKTLYPPILNIEPNFPIWKV